jgi:hypothetical protein
MVAKMNIAQQKAVLRLMSPTQKKKLKTHCQKCDMAGQGLASMLASAAKFIMPALKEIGLPVFKSLVLPWLSKKMSGKGHCGSGMHVGRGLNLPGSGMHVGRINTNRNKTKRRMY